MGPEFAHDGFECLFVLTNEGVELLILVEEDLVFGEDRDVGLFKFGVERICNGVWSVVSRKPGAVKSRKGKSSCLGRDQD